MLDIEPLTPVDLSLLASLAGDANVRRAAQELGVPRSTVSWRIADLERRLGQAVFLRRGRTLARTRFGETLLAVAVRARGALAELRAAASDDADQRLVIAAAPLFAEHVLPSVLPQLLAVRPNLRVEFRLSHTFADIFDERVDVALRRGPLVDSQSLAARRLGRLTMVCVASPSLQSYPDAEEDAASLPWIHVGARAEPFVLDVGSGRGKRTLRLPARVAVDNQRIALELVRRGVGAARVNLFMVREELALGTLREVLPDARSTADAFAVYPRRARSSAVVKQFLQLLVASQKQVTIWDDEPAWPRHRVR